MDKALNSFYEKCKVAINGNIISDEKLLKEFVKYIRETSCAAEHNVGLVMHTGSDCFDVLMLVHSVIVSILCSSITTVDIIDDLEVGDTVIYNDARYEFGGKTIMSHGRDSKSYVILYPSRGKKDKSYLPEQSWNQIMPYYGDAKTLGGRGIKAKHAKIREDFLIDVLGYKKTEISSQLDASTVFVTDKEHADFLASNVEIVFDGKTLKLLDLVTASFLTDNNEYNYPGNDSKSEPVIKFVNSINVARREIVSKRNNATVGLVVSGSSIIKRAETELPELINRRTLGFIYLSSTINQTVYGIVKSACENINSFACTKEFLDEYAGPDVGGNDYTSELKTLNNRIVNKSVEVNILDANIVSAEEYATLKKTLLKIKRLNIDRDITNSFIINSFSILNLLTTMFVSINEYNSLSNNPFSGVRSITDKMNVLSGLINDLPEMLKQDAVFCFETLQKISHLLSTTNPKGEWFLNYLKYNYNARTLIVVPKAYYSKFTSILSKKCNVKNITIVTDKKIPNELFDTVIVFGYYSNNQYDFFSNYKAKKNYLISYDYEFGMVRNQENQSKNFIKDLNTMSYLPLMVDLTSFDDNEEQSLQEQIEEDKELYDLEQSLWNTLRVTDTTIKYSGNGNNSETEISKIALLENSQIVYFSKQYTGYSFDSNNQEVKDIKVDKISEGDTLLFTVNNNQTRDIVDDVLELLIREPQYSKYSEKLAQSRKWKENLAIIKYRDSLSFPELAKILSFNGVEINAATLRTWMDENSHIVGPQNEKGILTNIAIVAKDDDMKRNVDLYCKSIIEIRQFRRKILNVIGQVIISKLENKDNNNDILNSIISERIEGQYQLLQVEAIESINEVVPAFLANKPLDI